MNFYVRLKYSFKNLPQQSFIHNGVVHLLVNYELCENQITFVENWIVMFVIYGFVHQRMWANEIQDGVGKACRVINTCARTRLRNFRVQHWQPSRVWCRLLLIFCCKRNKRKFLKYRQVKNFYSSRFPFPLPFHSWHSLTSELSFPFSILIEKTVNALERLLCFHEGTRVKQQREKEIANCEDSSILIIIYALFRNDSFSQRIGIVH